MLTTIVQHSAELLAFVAMLNLALNQPQMRHLVRIVDAIVTGNGRKTLSVLCRQWIDEPDPKAAADFFRESPWERGDIGQERKRWMLMKVLEIAKASGIEVPITVGVDDSLGKKGKATRHWEAVDFHHNHSEGTKCKPQFNNGYVYVELHVQIGPIGFTFDTRLYLRERTVRKLNRQRTADEHLAYRSKYALTCEMLKELATLLPKGYKVYVLFDSWYASAKLIKFCRRQGWHVICAVKSNRRINKKSVTQHDLALKHKHYQTITLNAADKTRKAPVYHVRTIFGQLEEVPGKVCAIISRRHRGDKRPKCFVCTDCTLSAQQALRLYQQRWPVEVDNFYLKEVLGLGDFRLQSFEATDKWFEVMLLSINYLQYQQAQDYAETHTAPILADVIRQHRLTHLQNLIRHVAEEACRTGNVEEVVRRFTPTATWAVT